MAGLVIVKPLQGKPRCFRFTVTNAVKVLTLPAEAAVIQIFNKTDTEALHYQPNAGTVAVPAAASATITETALTLYKTDGPITMELAAKQIAFIAEPAKTVEVWVNVFLQNLAA